MIKRTKLSALALAGALIAVPWAPGAEIAGAKPPLGSAAERRARMAPRAQKAHYAPVFDLSALPGYVPQQKVSGVLRVAGNNYIGDSGLAARWQKDFNRYQPALKLKFDLPSAAMAVPSLYLKQADVAMNHEPTFYDYLSHLRIFGFEPQGVSIVTGSLDVVGWQNTMVIVVHKDNPLTQITVEQLDGIFGSVRDGGWQGTKWRPDFARGPERDIRTWGQMGLTGDWTNARITPYGYSVRYATALEFSNRVLGASDKWNGDYRAFGNLRLPDGSQYLQANQIADRLKNDKYGIAYIRYQQGLPPDLKVLDLAWTSAGPYVKFTLENLQNRSYPLFSDQSMWYSRKPGARLDPKIREFLRYLLSRQGQQLVMEDGKYLPLTATAVREGLNKLD
jgi:phosphate transport system substrate-binding protein